MRFVVFASGILLASFSTGTVIAQVSETEQERVRVMAQEIAVLMETLEQRADAYPGFVADLEAGLVTIEQADETVEELIAELTAATDQMEDESEFDNAIDDYIEVTTQLIAEAESSPNEAIRSSVESLEGTLARLEQSDRLRASTVIQARNLISELEDNREALAFFIRVNQTQNAAEAIAAHIEQFGDIVEDGQSLAAGLIEASNP